MLAVAGIFCLLAAEALLSAQEPDAAEILRNARLGQISQNRELDAKLWGDDFKTIPFRVSLKNGEVSYEFTDPRERLILSFTEENSNLQVEDAKGRIFTPSPTDKVHGTNFTYEDLSMEFLYWPRAKVIGEETRNMMSCYKVEVHPLRYGTAYGVVRLWLDKKNGLLLKMEGYDGSGRLIKRFTVISGRKMRVETFVPETGKISDRAYLEVIEPG